VNVVCFGGPLDGGYVDVAMPPPPVWRHPIEAPPIAFRQIGARYPRWCWLYEYSPARNAYVVRAGHHDY